MTTSELTTWLRDNSSGIYRPARDAADRLEELVRQLEEERVVSETLKHQLQWIRTHCRIICFPASESAPYPIEHAPKARKDQWDALMAEAARAV